MPHCEPQRIHGDGARKHHTLSLAQSWLPGLLGFLASFVGTQDSVGSDSDIMESLSFLHPPLLPPVAVQSLFCVARAQVDRGEGPGAL